MVVNRAQLAQAPALAPRVAPAARVDASGPVQHLLELQRSAGNGAVCQLLVGTPKSSAGAKGAAKKPKAARNEFNDLVDFLDGFGDLAVAATKKGGTATYGTKLAPGLRDEHRATLERVRRVFIKAQGNAASRRAAQAEWPRLAAQLMAGVEAGRRAGMPAKYLTTVVDNIEAVGQHYVMAKQNRPDDGVTVSSGAAFADGVRQLVAIVDRQSYDRTNGVVPRNLDEVNRQQQAALRGVAFGPGLSKRHSALLEQLRTALVHARTRGGAKQAVSLWKTIGPEVLAVFDAGADKQLAQTRATLVDIGQKLIHGGLYSEKHNAALAGIGLKEPKEFIDVRQLEVVAQDLIVAKDIADKAIAISAGSTMNAIFAKAGLNQELGSAVWDLAKNPGEMKAKVDEFKKMGVLDQSVTVADLADKMLSLRQAAYSVSLRVIEDVAARQGKIALAKGAAEAVAKWKKVGEWAAGHLDAVEKVGKVAGRIAIGVSVIKVAAAIAKGDYTAAFQEVVSTALQYGATTAAAIPGAGLAGAGLMAGIGVVIAAEMEGISGAAAMIRHAKEHNAKEAALDFIHVCEKASAIEVKAMLADMKLLDDPDLADQHAEIQQRLLKHLEWWNRHLLELRELYHDKRVNALGGQQALRFSMGFKAKDALFDATPPTWEGLGNQVRDVFGGANNLSRFIVKNYGAKG